MERREFLAALLAAPLADTDKVPTRAAKVTRLFKAPDGHPNALETTPEGLWIGEQVTDRAHLVDWKGKVLRRGLPDITERIEGMVGTLMKKDMSLMRIAFEQSHRN